MINTGGWLVLSAIFALLLLLVQRSESKRRRVSLVIMVFVGYIVWRYAIFKMALSCFDFDTLGFCPMRWITQLAGDTAVRTINWSLITALIFNVLFWVLIGRSNPPRSSDAEIKVFGAND